MLANIILIFQVDIPEPSRGQVLVMVKACGLSLVDQKVCVLLPDLSRPTLFFLMDFNIHVYINTISMGLRFIIQ